MLVLCTDKNCCIEFTWQYVLFGEIVLAQKVMYEKFGDAFLRHFLSKGFPAAHCSQDLAEQYCQRLQVLLICNKNLAVQDMFYPANSFNIFTF